MRSYRLVIGTSVWLAMAATTIAQHGAPQHAPAPVPHGNPHTATAPTKTTTSASSASTTASGSTTTATSPTGTTTKPTTLNPIALKISSHPQLVSHLKPLMPAGMTLNQASLGFKNQGQFIAALHVSRNLGIRFADLKTAMTGIRPSTTSGASTTTSALTRTTTMSLGQAIHKLRPSANSIGAATTAEQQAQKDVSTSRTITTPTSHQ
jgi:hypothetical protein